MENKRDFSEGLTDLLIATLCSARSGKRLRQILNERKFNRYKKESVKVTLSRLSKNKYIENSESGWVITKKGQGLVEEKYLLSFIPSPFNKGDVKNTIISFDISEDNRRTRDWLRNQIKIFDYKMLQQSLWIGPGALPKDFLKRLQKLSIRSNVKIFKINKKQ